MARRIFKSVTRSSTPLQIHWALASTLTQYDRLEAEKARKNPRHYHNLYALGHYLGALQLVDDAIEMGVDVRTALLECFNGRLLDRLLAEIGEPRATRDELEKQRLSRGQGLD